MMAMPNLELREGADVFTHGDEQVGKVSGFVLDPATNEVTHIIVQKGWLFSEDRVLPFDMVRSATEDKLVLNENASNFDDLPAFEETHYIRTPDANLLPGGQTTAAEQRRYDRMIETDASHGKSPGVPSAPGYYWYPPHGYVGYPVEYTGLPPMATVRNIPEDTVPLKEGTDVISSDGQHVGDIERLLVGSEANRVTHFVISQGTFFKDRKLVPALWVRTIDEDGVHLSVASQLLERLPSYEE
jgi:uncharacterized protein YrrD